jgi:hypothetical protein
MRTFIRHPSDIPIEIDRASACLPIEERLHNVSSGGLCFVSENNLPEGAFITVRLPFVRPPFEAKARVVWCRGGDDLFDVGVEFVESEDSFKARMIEQVCRIEHYKKVIRETEGRELSGKEAALEWIGKFADSFQSESVSK